MRKRLTRTVVALVALTSCSDGSGPSGSSTTTPVSEVVAPPDPGTSVVGVPPSTEVGGGEQPGGEGKQAICTPAVELGEPPFVGGDAALWETYSLGAGEGGLGCPTGSRIDHGDWIELPMSSGMIAAVKGADGRVDPTNALPIQSVYEDSVRALLSRGAGKRLEHIDFVEDAVGDGFIAIFVERGTAEVRCSAAIRSDREAEPVIADGPLLNAILRYAGPGGVDERAFPYITTDDGVHYLVRVRRWDRSWGSHDTFVANYEAELEMSASGEVWYRSEALGGPYQFTSPRCDYSAVEALWSMG